MSAINQGVTRQPFLRFFALLLAIVASSGAIGSFVLTVQGVGTDLIHWTFKPQITASN